MDEKGNLVDGSGNRVDLEGNRIDENGYLLNDNGEHKLDDNGQYIMSTYLITSSSDSDTTLKEAISDTNVPAPPEEDESDTTENNDMESEGLQPVLNDYVYV